MSETAQGPPRETSSVRSEALAARVKDLLHEGNVRRITVRNDEGHTVLEIPVTAAVNQDGTLYTLGDHGIGTVAELLVDDERTEVRFLLVEHGGILGFGASATLVPVEAIRTVSEDEGVIDRSRDRVASAPAYSPGVVDERPFHASTYDHYGCVPTEGFLYPYYGTSR